MADVAVEAKLRAVLDNFEHEQLELVSTFDPIKLAESTDRIRTVFISGVGPVRFKHLTGKEAAEAFDAGKTPMDKMARVIFASLKHTHPDLTPALVEKWPVDVQVAIQDAINRESGFLRLRRMT